MNNTNINSSSSIITLQVGSFSNFIGSHYWNIQNDNYHYSLKNKLEYEINPSLLFRAGDSDKSSNVSSKSPDGLKYTPRVLVFDYADNFGCMNKEGTIYRHNSNSSSNLNNNFNKYSNYNQHNVTRYESTPIGSPIKIDENEDHRKSNFEYWSDYLQTDFTANNIVQLSQVNQNNNISGKLFQDGKDLLENSYDIIDLYQDNLRKMMEECDLMLGFQLFTDVDGIWGGISSALLDHIKDEYNSKSIVTFATTPYSSSIEASIEAAIDERLYNVANSIANIAQQSSIYIPLSAQRWSSPFSHKFNLLKMNNKYQTSSIIASTIDTATLYYRANFDYSVADFCRHLSLDSMRNICSLSTSYPNSIHEFNFDQMIKQHQEKQDVSVVPLFSNPLMNYLTPKFQSISNKYRPLTEIISIRGDLNGVSDYDKVKETLELNIQLSNRQGAYSNVLKRMICNIKQPFQIEKPNYYPAYQQIQPGSVSSSHLQSLLNENYYENQNSNNNNDSSILTPPPTTILTHLQNSAAINQYLQPLTDEYKDLVTHKRISRPNHSFDVDYDREQSATLEYLLSVTDSYSNAANH